MTAINVELSVVSLRIVKFVLLVTIQKFCYQVLVCTSGVNLFDAVHILRCRVHHYTVNFRTLGRPHLNFMTLCMVRIWPAGGPFYTTGIGWSMYLWLSATDRVTLYIVNYTYMYIVKFVYIL